MAGTRGHVFTFTVSTGDNDDDDDEGRADLHFYAFAAY